MLIGHDLGWIWCCKLCADRGNKGIKGAKANKGTKGIKANKGNKGTKGGVFWWLKKG